jgi:hypothetical protein
MRSEFAVFYVNVARVPRQVGSTEVDFGTKG